MNQESLGIGKLITSPQERDAIHIAVMPVIAYCSLQPGTSVGMCDDGQTATPYAEKTVGIIDPFLKRAVQPGERCWLFLYPGSITSLKHVWSHPTIDASPAPREYQAKKSLLDQERDEAWEWLRVMGEEYSFDPEELVRSLEAGEGYCFGRTCYHELIDREDFWEKIEAALGRPVSAKTRNGNHFHCAC